MNLTSAILFVSLSHAVYCVAADPEPLPWTELDQEEQRILGKAQPNWDQYPVERQQKLLAGARKWQSLSAAERRTMGRNLAKLKQMDPARREKVLQRLQKFKSLPANERARLRDSFTAYQRLPAQRRQQLREQWRQKSPAERQQLRSGWRHEQLDRRRDDGRQAQNRPEVNRDRARSNDAPRERWQRQGKRFDSKARPQLDRTR